MTGQGRDVRGRGQSGMCANRLIATGVCTRDRGHMKSFNQLTRMQHCATRYCTILHKLKLCLEYHSTSQLGHNLEDVSPDFYAWVFPKCDHVAVGTGTVIDKKGIQRPLGKDLRIHRRASHRRKQDRILQIVRYCLVTVL